MDLEAPRKTTTGGVCVIAGDGESKTTWRSRLLLGVDLLRSYACFFEPFFDLSSFFKSGDWLGYDGMVDVGDLLVYFLPLNLMHRLRHCHPGALRITQRIDRPIKIPNCRPPTIAIIYTSPLLNRSARLDLRTSILLFRHIMTTIFHAGGLVR